MIRILAMLSALLFTAPAYAETDLSIYGTAEQIAKWDAEIVSSIEDVSLENVKKLYEKAIHVQYIIHETFKNSDKRQEDLVLEFKDNFNVSLDILHGVASLYIGEEVNEHIAKAQFFLTVLYANGSPMIEANMYKAVQFYNMATFPDFLAGYFAVDFYFNGPFAQFKEEYVKKVSLDDISTLLQSLEVGLGLEKSLDALDMLTKNIHLSFKYDRKKLLTWYRRYQE